MSRSPTPLGQGSVYFVSLAESGQCVIGIAVWYFCLSDINGQDIHVLHLSLSLYYIGPYNEILKAL